MALEALELLLVSCPLTGSSLPLSSWWGTGRTTSRCFLAGPLGAPHAIGLVFPVPSIMALWDPPVGSSQRGILLSYGCLKHVLL